MKVSIFIGLGVALLIGVAIFGALDLESRADTCKASGGVLVQTPAGWHCLTKGELL